MVKATSCPLGSVGQALLSQLGKKEKGHRDGERGERGKSVGKGRELPVDCLSASPALLLLSVIFLLRLRIARDRDTHGEAEIRTGKQRIGSRLRRYREACDTRDRQEPVPQPQTSGGRTLPESFVQGDALGLVLTEVHPWCTVVNHLVTQFTWWGWRQTAQLLRHGGH